MALVTELGRPDRHCTIARHKARRLCALLAGPHRVCGCNSRNGYICSRYSRADPALHNPPRIIAPVPKQAAKCIGPVVGPHMGFRQTPHRHRRRYTAMYARSCTFTLLWQQIMFVGPLSMSLFDTDLSSNALITHLQGAKTFPLIPKINLSFIFYL